MQLSIRRPDSRILIACILSLVFLFGTILGWANNHVLYENDRFCSFTDWLFKEEVSGNMLNLHYSLAYPEKNGISRPTPDLGTVSLPSDDTTDTDHNKKLLQKLQKFDSSKLSLDNQITLDMLLLYYKTQTAFEGCELLYEPLSPSLGIQSQLPILLAEYTFYQEQDIADYLNLLTSVDSYFDSILAFEKEKSDAGYFMSDTTLDRIQEQCRAFIQNPDSNYMLTVFAEKIQELELFSKEDQKILNQKHNEILMNKVIPAYQNLIDGLESLRGTGRPSQGLAHLDHGQKYYLFLLQSQTGTYQPVKEIQKRMTEQLSSDMNAVRQLIQENPSILQNLDNEYSLSVQEPTDILNALQKKMSEVFPSLPETDFQIRYVHESMQDYLSPAFYLTPPLDTRSPNTIYINPSDQKTNLELFTTLAHEGFPGHLYQTVYFGNTQPDDIRYLITSSGYAEGWATYTESYGYQYAADYMDDPDTSAHTYLAWLNRSINLCIYSLLDIGIHYYGWDQSQTARFLQTFGIKEEQVISEIFQYIVETPGNYLKYYWGYLNFLDLKKEWQDALGDDFDLKLFHQRILEIGPVQFPVLQKYMCKYLQELKPTVSEETIAKGGADMHLPLHSL